MELVARQQAAQAASDQMARYSSGVQAQAQQRALQALLQSGQLGGQMRDQDFSEQSQKARAQDLINQFNTQTLNQASQYNVGNRNQAQQLNNAELQRINDANVLTRNKEKDRRLDFGQQQFDNKYRVAQGKAGAANTQAGYYGDRAKGTQGQWGGMMQGVNQMIGTGMQYGQQQDQAEQAKLQSDRDYELQKGYYDYLKNKK
jgi:hypothetical protein